MAIISGGCRCVPTSISLMPGFFDLLRNLPPELKLVIFFHATGVELLTTRESARQRGAVCMVCKEWAAVTYIVHRVWNRISVGFAYGFEAAPVMACIQNSGALPLEVSIDVSTGPTDGDEVSPPASGDLETFVHDYFTLLEPHFHRVRVFKITCRDRPASDLAMTYLLRMNCVNLRDLSLAVNPTQTDHPIHLSSLPALSYLYCAKSLPPKTMDPLAASVKHLELVGMDYGTRPHWAQWLHTLTIFSGVERLKLGDVGSRDRPPAPSAASIVSFHRLQHFTLTLSSLRSVHIVQLLDTPSLRYLRLTVKRTGAIATFISACEITLGRPASLDLCWRESLSDDLCLTLLNACRRIIILKISRLFDEDRPTAIRALSSPELALPNLRRIVLNWEVDLADVRLILADGRMHRDCSLTYLSSETREAAVLLPGKPKEFCTWTMGADDVIRM
ncbi:hypothetical protein DFH06DRAFT_1139427 [Mycena polygramma]|nr:hypothetical protein DFH06DRAFT_1139427 [Mycena polygramma]